MTNVQSAYEVLAPDYLKTLGCTADYLGTEIAAFYDRVPGGSLVLDAGCGPGKEARMGAARGHQFIGLDLSREMLNLFQKELPQAKTLQGSLSQIPLAENSVDVLFNAMSLLHLPPEEGQRAIAEFARVLKDNGRFLLFTTVMEGAAWEEKDTRPYLTDRGIPFLYFYHWNREALLSELRRQGFVFATPNLKEIKAGRPSVIIVEGHLEKHRALP